MKPCRINDECEICYDKTNPLVDLEDDGEYSLHICEDCLKKALALFVDQKSFGGPSIKYSFQQCECGGYRLSSFVDGKWRWSAGCRACDEIMRLKTRIYEIATRSGLV